MAKTQEYKTAQRKRRETDNSADITDQYLSEIQAAGRTVLENYDNDADELIAEIESIIAEHDQTEA